MTTLHDLPPLTAEMATSAYVQGIQGSEYRPLSSSYEPGFAMYSEKHMQSYARQAIDHHMAQLAERSEVMPRELNDPDGGPFCWASEVREAIATMQARIEQVEGDRDAFKVDAEKHMNNLRTAVNALRSYQYGNTSEQLAASIANALDEYIDTARSKT